MSAIFGLFNLDNKPVDNSHGNGLMRALEKYPANDVQTWNKDNIFLGCHAQWITPESVGEKLPYYDSKRQLAITADAIIDNRDELFNQLHIDQLYRKTMADSELILLAYNKWGEDSAKHLIGDFAFMIWDERKHLLFGARDFAGNRTLYYHNNRHHFTFCTTIYPLFSLPYIEKKLNEQWLAEYLAIPGMLDAVDSFSTVYKNIKQVPPAHTICISADRISLSKYCAIIPDEKLKLKSNREYEEAFCEVVETAVTAGLRTNHKIGAQLSGGLDSGTVVSFASRALRKQRKQLYTFSYVPPADFVDWTPKRRIADERPFIQATVNHVGNIKANYLAFEGRSPLTEIDDLLETLEMPYKYVGNSFWINGIYKEAHRKHVGILLTGSDGNYSISWGPALDYYSILLKRLRWFKLFRELHLYSNNLGLRKKFLFSLITKKAFPLVQRFLSSNEDDDFPMIINSEFAKQTCVYERLRSYGDIPGFTTGVNSMYEARRRLFEQLSFWNITSTGMTKQSLRLSLWVRDPTKDLRVVRFCLSVPDDQFVQNGLDRALVRRSTEGYLPDKVRLNQRIRGLQGADTIHRMTPCWNEFILELERMCADDMVKEFFNLPVLRAAIAKVRAKPRPEYLGDLDFKVLLRSLVVYRFLKTIN